MAKSQPVLLGLRRLLWHINSAYASHYSIICCIRIQIDGFVNKLLRQCAYNTISFVILHALGLFLSTTYTLLASGLLYYKSVAPDSLMSKPFLPRIVSNLVVDTGISTSIFVDCCFLLHRSFCCLVRILVRTGLYRALDTYIRNFPPFIGFG